MAKTLLTIPLSQPDSGPFGNSGTKGLNPFGRGNRNRRVTSVFAEGGQTDEKPKRLRARRTFKKGGSVPHFDFGGLFGGSSGTSTTQTSGAVQSTGATNNNIASQPYMNLENQVLGTAAGLQGAQASQYIAPFNQTQQQAFQGVQNNQGSYQPYYQAAGAGFSGAQNTAAGIPGNQAYVTQAGQMQNGTQASSPYFQQADQTAPSQVNNYLSPFITNAVDALGQASNKAFTAPGGPLNQINDTFTGGAAAQFGREQHGATVDNAVYNQQQALAQQQAQLLNSGYQSSLNAAQTDLQRQAGLGSTAGSLANTDINTRAGLGTAGATIGQAGTNAQISAGQAQQGLGTATQGAGYTDANALLSIGNQQQQQQQQQMSFPLQLAQYQQSLGQGWQLPTSSNFLNTNNSGGTSTTTGTPASGSPFGQVLGGATALYGAVAPLFNGSSTQNTANGSGTTYAEGGPFEPKRFNTGGYMPTVTGVRKRNALRKPPQPGPMGAMGGMQPTGMPGMPPAAPPTAQALAPSPMPPPPQAGPMGGPMRPMQHHAHGGQHRGPFYAPGGPVGGNPMPAAQQNNVLPDGSVAPPAGPFGAMSQQAMANGTPLQPAMMPSQPVQAAMPPPPPMQMPQGAAAGVSDAGVSDAGVGEGGSTGGGGSAAAGVGDGTGGDGAGGGTYAHGGPFGYADGGATLGDALDVPDTTDPLAAILAAAPKAGASQAKFGPFGPLGNLPGAEPAAGNAAAGGGGKLGGALSGAASGAMAGMALGPYGALAGGVLGGLSGLFKAEGGQYDPGKFDYGDNPFTHRFSHPGLALRVAQYYARGGMVANGQGNYGVGTIPHMPRSGVPGDPYFASRARGGPFG